MTDSPLQTPYQEFIYKRTYSRWLEDEQRRETWSETVARYKEFFKKRVPREFEEEFEKAIDDVYNLRVMPSMRALWTAGPALERDNVAGYNCAYTVIESPRDFAEILYILMCGTGVGFSTERQYINKLPVVPDVLHRVDDVIVVEDSRIGWAKAFYNLLNYLYDGEIPRIDYSRIRPKGARLKTFGGRASGPEPLKQLFDFTLNIFQNARGRKLNSLECYDIVCMTASIVIAGGVRRSATINLSNLSDQRMKHAKDGQFWIDNPQRTLSNNSVAYTEKPDITVFMEEWMNLMKSGTGERGIVNRQGLKIQAAHIGRDCGYEFGVNPCGEVILRPRQFCNLTEVVVRPDDDLDSLLRKATSATILGVLQSTLTDFRFLSDEWKKNVEEERLLGVSLTGLRDHPILSAHSDKAKRWLASLRRQTRDVAVLWSSVLGINTPKAITSVKPSGTVSQLVDSSSGIHPRFSQYYIRRVRVASSDPLAKFLIDQGVPYYPEVGQDWNSCTTVVFEFPMKAPEGAVIRGTETAIEQLEYWKMIKEYWTDHNPSNTIYVKPDEWLEVGAWVYKNFNIVTGLTFFPYDNGVYQLAPYEEIDEETYNKLVKTMPEEIDWDRLNEYEKEDTTTGAREWACSGDKCEIV